MVHRLDHDTHHDGVQPRQLEHYLNEFTFRYHHRWPRSRGLLFHRLMQHAAAVPATPYPDLIARKGGPPASEGQNLLQIDTPKKQNSGLLTFLRSCLHLT